MLDWRSIPDAIGKCFEPRYVYLCRFERIAKVGVTRSPRRRIMALRRTYGEPVEVHVRHVGYFESCRREAVVKHAFGLPSKAKGRRVEFFPVENFPAALAMIAAKTAEWRPEWMRAVNAHAAHEAVYGYGRDA
jgi:hypothetical protein